MKSPRIYIYKVTFEEIPHWYWGVHKEKFFNDGYLGSPATHRWMWDFYTPHLQICEEFPCTDEGWSQASSVEKRVIRHDLNNPLCLNEGCGGVYSLEVLRQTGRSVALSLNFEKDEEGRSVNAVKGGKTTMSVKDEFGKSRNAVKACEILHAERDENGKSIRALRHNEKLHSNKTENGKSAHAVSMGTKGGEKGSKTTNNQLWESTIDGFKGRACSVALHNKSNGWDTNARVRVK